MEKTKKVYIISPEKRRQYNLKYNENKKTKEVVQCDICFGRYKGISNKYHHNSTKKHTNALRIREDEKNKLAI